MNKRIIAVVLCLFVFSMFVLPYKQKAFAADPLTITQVAAAAYGIGSTYGMSLIPPYAGQVTPDAAQNFMETEINNYMNGLSVTEVFGSDPIKAIAGKMVIGQVAFNSIVDFLQNLSTKYNLGANFATMGYVFGDNFASNKDHIDLPTLCGFSVNVEQGSNYWLGRWTGPNYTGSQYGNISSRYEYDGLYYWQYGTIGYKATLMFHNLTSNKTFEMPEIYWSTIQNKTGITRVPWYGKSTGEIGSATVLNPDKAWSGTIPGYDAPDTNLDQMVGGIFQEVADTNLDVDGEIIDVPVPPQPVPTWTPVDDVIDGINQTGEMLEGIGNDIGDISGHLDDMGDQIDSINQSLEGVQEEVQTQTGVLSGAIDQATSDVVDAIGEQTAVLDQTLTETAEGVQDIAEALKPGEIEPKKFDLRGLFPFCIPFDIHNLLQKFKAEPVAPHVQLPFIIESIGFSYMLDLDFSAFDTLAAAVRNVEYIVFAIGLAWATSKVIKW